MSKANKYQEEATGIIEFIRYHKDDFLIATLDNGLTIKGSMLEPQIGREYLFQGNIENHKTFGKQFAFTGYQSTAPTSRAAVLYYLAHNAKWIGAGISKKAYDLYDTDTLTVLKDDPTRAAREIKGLSADHAKEASDMLRANEASERALLELRDVIGSAKLSQNQMNRIIELWKHEAAAYVRKYPYRMPELIHGIGFHTADEIAFRLGYARDGAPRIEAGVLHTLKQAQMDGHVCLPMNTLVSEAKGLLGIARELIQPVIDDMDEEVKERLLINDGGHVYYYASYMDECYIADKIKELSKALPKVDPWGTVDTSSLFDDQRGALEAAKSAPVFIVTGAPGVGKSFLIKAMLDMFMGGSVALCAPTGKASKRMMELTGQPARTIHSLLCPLPQKGGMVFMKNEAEPLMENVIVVDECSMVDSWLMASLLRAIKPTSRLILVGDTNQLPSVGAGSILSELIDSEVIPCVELTQIKRQDPGLIIRNCHAIRRGESDIEHEGALDFHFIEEHRPHEIQAIIKDLMISAGKKNSNLFEDVDKHFDTVGSLDVLRDVQVLSPLRKKTDLSVLALNKELQKLLNPNARFNQKERAGYTFSRGDKVIQKKNENELGIINGDLGYVMSLDHSEKTITVTFENPDRTVELDMFENRLELAYAITCHSAQGSEWPVVIIPIHDSFGSLIMQRNWLYTAISRAQKLCILVGQSEQIPKIIGRNRQSFRHTQLAFKINPELEIW